MNTVKLVKQRLNTDLQVEGVVLTMFDARTNLSGQVVNEVKKFFKNKVVNPRTYISSYAAENIQIELNAGKFIGKTLEWGIRNE